MAALLVDLKGQVVEAFKHSYYLKWGRHYLPSLCFAHLNQIFNNFKDPGVQSYGGKMLQTLWNQAEELFRSLTSGTFNYTMASYLVGELMDISPKYFKADDISATCSV